jgi:hypothetical protein
MYIIEQMIIVAAEKYAKSHVNDARDKQAKH